MTPATHPPPIAPPDDPVRRAAEDPETRAGLLAHACARLGHLLGDRPAIARKELAEEAVQEVLRRALTRSAGYDPARATPIGWLHGFLNHVLSEQCREVRKQPAQPDADPAVWDALEARLAGDAPDLTDLLDALPADQRHIVSIHHLDGMSHREIADRLGISEAASRVRLARAMNALRQLAARKEGGR